VWYGAPENLNFGVFWVLTNRIRTLIARGLTAPVTVTTAAVKELTAVITVPIQSSDKSAGNESGKVFISHKYDNGKGKLETYFCCYYALRRGAYPEISGRNPPETGSNPESW